MEVSILSGHRRVPAFGLAGGGEGVVGENSVSKRNSLARQLPSTTSLGVEEGDTLTLCTPGGGGFG